jgi:hypothetical protein
MLLLHSLLHVLWAAATATYSKYDDALLGLVYTGVVDTIYLGMLFYRHNNTGIIYQSPIGIDGVGVYYAFTAYPHIIHTSIICEIIPL